MSKPLDMVLVNRTKASRLAFTILHTVQDEELPYMAAALGLLLRTLCETKGLDPQDIMTAADNMLRTTGMQDDNYVTALRAFIRDDIN